MRSQYRNILGFFITTYEYVIYTFSLSSSFSNPNEWLAYLNILLTLTLGTSLFHLIHHISPNIMILNIFYFYCPFLQHNLDVRVLSRDDL